MRPDSMSAELEDVDETGSKTPLLSLRQKMGLAISMYLAACTIIFACALPALTESWNQVLADLNRSDFLEKVPLQRIAVAGEVLTYSFRRNLTIIARENESRLPDQSTTYFVETSQMNNRTGTYVQKQGTEGYSFTQTYNLTTTNDMVTFKTNGGWANETEIMFITPLNLHLQNLHIVPLPEEQVGVGDSWRMDFRREAEEFGRHETITVRALFYLESQTEVVTETGKHNCHVVKGVWEGDGVSKNLSTGEEIGRTRVEASTTHWIDNRHRFVVKADKIEKIISYGWQAQLAGGIMGLEDYRSLNRIESRSRVCQVLIMRQLAEGAGS